MTSVMFKTELSQTEATLNARGGMKSVLLHVQDDDGLEARLQTALNVVRASGGHLSCTHVTPPSAFSGFDSLGAGKVLADLIGQLEDREAALQARIEAHLASEDVSWTYDRLTSDPASAMVRGGALADLIVLGRSSSGQGSPYRPVSVISDVLAASHTPLMVCSDDRKGFDPFGPAAIAWNGSFEASNALRAVLPLLRQASSVHIVIVDEDRQADFPPLGASEYLSRHDVHAEMIRETRGTQSVEDRLIATANALGAGYMVMGAYGHSRARETLFGGVTRNLLKDCPISLLLSR